MPDQLTLLTHENALATKRWKLVNGRPVEEAYGQGKYFAASAVTVDGPHQLAAALEALAACPQTFVIRGELTPGVDPARVRRAKRASADGPPCFKEVPRSWLMLDVDGTILTPQEMAGFDVRRAADAEALVWLALQKLPPYFHGVTVVWQLSSSAGMKPGFRAHLWFWLDRAMGETELRRWAGDVNDGGKKIDPSVFGTVQPHYVAAPVWDVGLVDEVERRVGTIPGSVDVLSLPRTTGERRDSYRRFLDLLKNPLNDHIHDHVRDACAAFFCSRGADADATSFTQDLLAAVGVAEQNQGRVGDYPAEKVLTYLDGGREYARRAAAVGENLIRAGNGTPVATVGNAVKILAADERWKDVLGFDERALRCVFLKAPPWDPGYAGTASKLPRPVEDVDAQRLATWFGTHHQMPVGDSVAWAAMITQAHERRFDRVREYLESLSWDGEGRLDTWLPVYCQTLDKPYTRRVGAMWMISAVARALEPGSQVDTMLILEGAQGVFKSSLCRELAGAPELFGDDLPDIHSKDAKEYIHGPWIVEVKEWHKFKGREADAVKGFVDLRVDRFRPSYGRSTQAYGRRCVFIGTTNQSEYLNDPTGARRFWPVQVGQIDLQAVREDRDQLWAEAVARFKAGEPWWTEVGDRAFAEEQDQRFESDAWEGAVLGALKDGAKALGLPVSPAIPAACTVTTVAQLLEHALNIPPARQDKSAQMRITAILQRLGWVSTRAYVDGKQARCWVKL